MNDILWNLALDFGLRRQEIMVIGTNRKNTLKYIGDHYDVGTNPKCTIHTNTTVYIYDRKVTKLSKSDIIQCLDTYDKVIFYSTPENTKSVSNMIKHERLFVYSY